METPRGASLHRAAFLGIAFASLMVQTCAASHLRLSGFAPDLPGTDLDDAVEIENVGDETEALDGLAISDGEGVWNLPTGLSLASGGRLVVAGNGTSWRLASLEPADVALAPETGGASLGGATGDFRLAKTGDEIELRRDGALLDVVAYGKATASEGWAGPALDLGGGAFLRWYARLAGPDTDTAGDWTHSKPLFVGGTDHDRRSFDVEGPILAYASPDASRSVVRSLFGSAISSLHANAYDLRDATLAADIADRARGAVEVQILVDGNPVGETPEERRLKDGMFVELERAGADVRLSLHDRIAFNHAKYAIVDHGLTMVQTENLVPSGLSSDPRSGNRGWGVIVSDAEVAHYFEEVFEADFAARAWWAADWTAANAGPLQPPFLASGEEGGSPRFPPRLVPGPHVVTPVLAPDHSLEEDDAVLSALHGARGSIRIVQLNAPLQWGPTAANGYLEAAAEAAKRGAEVRILLDGHFVDEDPLTPDNADTVAALNGLGLPNLTARLWGPEEFGVLHAKGLVIDDRVTLVGSMNWNLNSVARNREVSLLIDSPGVAQFFAEVFDTDWADATPKAKTTPSLDGLVLGATVITAAVLFGHARHRR